MTDSVFLPDMTDSMTLIIDGRLYDTVTITYKTTKTDFMILILILPNYTKSSTSHLYFVFVVSEFCKSNDQRGYKRIVFE